VSASRTILDRPAFSAPREHSAGPPSVQVVRPAIALLARCSSPDGAAIAGRSTWTSVVPTRPDVGRGRAVERKQGKQRTGSEHSRKQRHDWQYSVTSHWEQGQKR
jgi:hypothetical protein